MWIRKNVWLKREIYKWLVRFFNIDKPSNEYRAYVKHGNQKVEAKK